jgi:hypothetical protein
LRDSRESRVGRRGVNCGVNGGFAVVRVHLDDTLVDQDLELEAIQSAAECGAHGADGESRLPVRSAPQVETDLRRRARRDIGAALEAITRHLIERDRRPGSDVKDSLCDRLATTCLGCRSRLLPQKPVGAD